MLVLGIFIIVVTGLLTVNFFSVKFSWNEQVGLSFPIGMGIQTFLMAVINMMGFRLTVASLLITGIIGIIALLVSLYLRRSEFINYYRHSFSFKIPNGNLVWLFFVILIVYFEYMNFAKCMYFPTFDRDSLAGFDTIGYVIAREHTFRGLSLFQQDYIPQIHYAGSYIVYAPMVQLSYAFVYILGAETSKLVPACMYLFFLIAFYGSMRRVISRTGAAIATFLMMITPEMVAFSSLSATNVMHAISASLGIIYLSLWFRYRERRDLYLSAFLLALNVWTRTDGLVFIGAALFAVCISSVKGKQWGAIWPVLASLAPTLFWMLFAKSSDFYAESIVTPYLYWDVGKAMVIGEFMTSHLMNTQYYGWTFIVLLFSLLLNSWYLIKRKDNCFLLFMMTIALELYILVLYQIDYKWDSIQQVLAYSAKRFLFCFIPIAWFYSVSNRWAVKLLKKIDAYLS